MTDKNRVEHFVKKLSASPEETMSRADDCCQDDCCKDDCHDDCCKEDCCKDDCTDDCCKECKHDDCCPTRGISFSNILLSVKDIKI